MAQWLHDSILESNNTITHPTTGDQKNLFEGFKLKGAKKEILCYLTILSTAFFPSMNPLGMQFGQRISYLWRNSWKRILLGKPCLQILIPSSTPLHRSCSSTRGESIFPAWTKTILKKYSNSHPLNKKPTIFLNVDPIPFSCKSM